MKLPSEYSTDSSSPTLASSPFDDLEADIVLRTSDNVLFRVYRNILCLSSSVFKTMFTLPQPPDSMKAPSLAKGTDKQKSPEILISEDSNTLHIVLCVCYPGAYPTFKDFGEVKLVIGALTKYDMLELANHRVKPLLESFISEVPLRMFAVAYHYGWKEVTEQAAREWLRRPVNDDYVEELELITAGTLYRLLAYRKRCGEAASGVTSNLRWIDVQSERDSRLWFTCTSCAVANPQSWVLSDGNSYPVRAWFITYLTAMGLELKKCPASDIPVQVSCLNQYLAAACKKCRCTSSTAITELSAFATGIFTTQVQKVISEVDLELEL